MALLHWRDNMSVGVEAVDNDHKHLVDLLNKLHFLRLAGADRASVGEVLEELLRYTEYHFEREEKLMESCSYPDLADHRELHQDLARKLWEYTKTFEDRPDSFDIETFYDFLSDWLLVYVLDKDMKYKPYVLGEVDA